MYDFRKTLLVVVCTGEKKLPSFEFLKILSDFSKNGEVEETGLGAGVLNNPALGIAWLANRLAQYGDAISAGQIVLSGSFIRPVETSSGSLIEADFGKFGQVSCRF